MSTSTGRAEQTDGAVFQARSELLARLAEQFVRHRSRRQDRLHYVAEMGCPRET